MKRPGRTSHPLGRAAAAAAPIATFAILLASAAVPGQRSSVGAGEHTREVAAALAAVPLKLGNWIGSEVPVPTEAAEILQTNAILSREYAEIGGTRAVTLAVIHCADLRDMVGHYPPVCYPANGWSLQQGEEPAATVRLAGGSSLSLQRYLFVRADRQGDLRMMTILNGFLLPDGTSTTSMRELTDRSERRAASSLGAVQFQLVFRGDIAMPAATEVAKDLLSDLPSPLLSELGSQSPGGGEREPRSSGTETPHG